MEEREAMTLYFILLLFFIQFSYSSFISSSNGGGVDIILIGRKDLKFYKKYGLSPESSSSSSLKFGILK
jgi:hypothetical protein